MRRWAPVVLAVGKRAGGAFEGKDWVRERGSAEELESWEGRRRTVELVAVLGAAVRTQVEELVSVHGDGYW